MDVSSTVTNYSFKFLTIQGSYLPICTRYVLTFNISMFCYVASCNRLTIRKKKLARTEVCLSSNLDILILILIKQAPWAAEE